MPLPHVAGRWSVPRSPRHRGRYRSSGPEPHFLRSRYKPVREEADGKGRVHTYRVARQIGPRHPPRLQHRRPRLGQRHARQRCHPCQRKEEGERRAEERIRSRVARVVPGAGLEVTIRGEALQSDVVFLRGGSECCVTDKEKESNRVHIPFFVRDQVERRVTLAEGGGRGQGRRARSSRDATRSLVGASNRHTRVDSRLRFGRHWYALTCKYSLCIDWQIPFCVHSLVCCAQSPFWLQ